MVSEGAARNRAATPGGAAHGLRPPVILLSAAEPSGDAIGAALIQGLKKRTGGNVAVIGAGGPAMEKAGLSSLYDIAPLGVAGLRDVLGAIPAVLNRAGRLAALAEEMRPDAAILIDGWGFHHQVATRLRRRTPDLPIVRYATPQVWASRPHRAAGIKPYVDMALTLFPFEPAYFTAHGIDARFVGHPVFERPYEPEAGERFRAEHGVAPTAPLLAVLPGSRPHELRSLIPVFSKTLRRVAERVKGVRIVMATTPRNEDHVRRVARAWSERSIVVSAAEDKRAAFAAADAALAASGTVVTELAHARTPTLVCYKVGPLTYRWALRHIVVKHAAVPNVVAGREVMPEYIQDLCRPSLLAPAIIRLLTEPALRKEMAGAIDAQMAKLKGDIGRPGHPRRPGEAAADAVLDLVARRRAAQRPAIG